MNQLYESLKDQPEPISGWHDKKPQQWFEIVKRGLTAPNPASVNFTTMAAMLGGADDVRVWLLTTEQKAQFIAIIQSAQQKLAQLMTPSPADQKLKLALQSSPNAADTIVGTVGTVEEAAF